MENISVNFFLILTSGLGDIIYRKGVQTVKDARRTLADHNNIFT